MKTYKTVPGPMNISVERGKAQDAMKSFEGLINDNSRNGWEYHSMEVITVTEKPGCFGSPTMTNYYMLIFCKDV